MIPKRKGLARLSIFHRQVRQKRILNKFYSKALCHGAKFIGVEFKNVNFKGAILTECIFKNCTFSNVEFLGSNLKKSNFSGSFFKYCVFSAALLKNANFKNCCFEKCTFVCTNLSNAKNLYIADENSILDKHITLNLDNEFMALLDCLRLHPKLQNTRVLFLKGGKPNSLTINSLIARLGIDRCKAGFAKLPSQLNSRIVTANQLCLLIDSLSKPRLA